MERCVGKDLQFGDNIVGELRKGQTPASEWGYQGQTRPAYTEILSATLNAADTSRIFMGLGGMSIEELAFFQRPDITPEETRPIWEEHANKGEPHWTHWSGCSGRAC